MQRANVIAICIVTGLIVAFTVLVLVTGYLLYHCHGKQSPDHVQLQDELNDENGYHDDVISNQLTTQPAQEAGSSGDQLQVGSIGLTTPTESSQSQCSKPTVEELIHNKFMSQYHPVPSSSLVGFQNYHSNLAI